MKNQSILRALCRIMAALMLISALALPAMALTAHAEEAATDAEYEAKKQAYREKIMADDVTTDSVKHVLTKYNISYNQPLKANRHNRFSYPCVTRIRKNTSAVLTGGASLSVGCKASLVSFLIGSHTSAKITHITVRRI